MKGRIVIDLDGTITIGGREYRDEVPRKGVVDALHRYRDQGFTIVIHTARNMRTYEGNVGLINVRTLPGIIEWLDAHEVPYDEIVVGKVWCGDDGFYVDDRAVRPDEFESMTHAEIIAMLEAR